MVSAIILLIFLPIGILITLLLAVANKGKSLFLTDDQIKQGMLKHHLERAVFNINV